MTIKQTFVKVGRTISKHSPTLFVAGGIAGFGFTAYLAYKSKDKVEEVVVEIEEKRSKDLPVDKVEAVKDLAVALYQPITMGVISTTSIIMAHRIQRNRILTLTGALAAQQAQSYMLEKKYKEEHGEEAYQKFITPVETVEVETEDAKGKKKVTKEDVVVEIDKSIGQWYNDSEHYVSDDVAYNRAYIESVQERLDNRLFQRGTLLLNEVLEELGFERIRAGALLGWTGADNFELLTSVVNAPEVAGGEPKSNIWVTWSRAKYIYEDVEFNDRYGIY